MDSLTVTQLALAGAFGLLAGFVKGAVGFALPLILISTLSLILPPQVALAVLIIPVVLGNLWQALRYGWRAALEAAKEYRRYILIVICMIALSAQLVTRLPERAMLLAVGTPITVFAMLMLAGWRPEIAPHNKQRIETIIALVAGFIGGLSGTWGPPTVAYLTALDTPKSRSVLVQGVVYGIGSLMLLGGHLASGVLTRATLPLSLGMVVPVFVGMALGMRAQARLPQERFRQITLAVLVIAGLNLIRRGLMG